MPHVLRKHLLKLDVARYSFAAASGGRILSYPHVVAFATTLPQSVLLLEDPPLAPLWCLSRIRFAADVGGDRLPLFLCLNESTFTCRHAGAPAPGAVCERLRLLLDEIQNPGSSEDRLRPPAPLPWGATFSPWTLSWLDRAF